MKSRQSPVSDTLKDTELAYAAWMDALLSHFGGSKSKVANAIHAIAKKTDSTRKNPDLERLKNAVPHWFSDRRSAPDIDDELISNALVELISTAGFKPPKIAKNTFEETLSDLQEIRYRRKIQARQQAPNVQELLDKNVVEYPVSRIEDFDIGQIPDQLSALFNNEVPNYSTRELDVLLLANLEAKDKDIAILSGPPKSGKTRTALEILKKSRLRKREIYWLSPKKGALEELLQTLQSSSRLNSVIFIDDLQRFSSDPYDGLTPAKFRDLARRGKIVATVHTSALNTFLNIPDRLNVQSVSSNIGEAVAAGQVDKSLTFKEVLERSVFVLDKNLKPGELELLDKSIRSALKIDKEQKHFPLAATLASIDELAKKAITILERGDVSSAMLFAVLDSYLAFRNGAPEDVIFTLAKYHYSQIQVNSRWRELEAQDAFDELTKGVIPGSDKAILVRNLVDGENFSLLDGLWSYLAPQPDLWSPEPLKLIADDDELVTISDRLYDLGYANHTKALLDELVAKDFLRAILFYGHMLAADGDLDGAIEWYTKASNRGSSSAQNQIGRLFYERGDIETANSWYEKCAQTGDQWGQLNLGYNLMHAGKTDEAVHWLTLSANQNNSMAQNYLGILYGTQGDEKSAELWYRKSAEAGYEWGQRNLGVTLKDSGDFDEAKVWLLKASDQGNADAQNALGNLFYDLGEIDLAKEWYLKSAESDFAWGQRNMGYVAKTEGDFVTAKYWLSKAAEADNADAQVLLGTLFAAEGDLAQAEFWYLKSAEAGNEWGMLNYGLTLKDKQNFEDAKTWILKSAELNNSDAQNQIGLYYREQSDPKTARQWFQKSAESGNPWGQVNFAEYLEQEGDLTEATKWLELSASQGNFAAHNSLGVIVGRAGDMKSAREHWLISAEGGDEWGQHNLGMDYLRNSDKANARKYLEMSAAQQLVSSQFELGKMLLEEGEDKSALPWLQKAAESGWAHAQAFLADHFSQKGNFAKAIFWYKKAADTGDEQALKALEVLERRKKTTPFSRDLDTPLPEPKGKTKQSSKG